jgi:hypothetical protein
MYYENPPEFEAIRFMPLFNPPIMNRGAGPHPLAPAPPAAPEPHFRPWPGPPPRPVGGNPFQPRPAPVEAAAPRALPRPNTVFQEQWDFIRLVEDLNQTQQQHTNLRHANMRQAEPGNNFLDAFFMFSTEQLMGRTR